MSPSRSPRGETEPLLGSPQDRPDVDDGHDAPLIDSDASSPQRSFANVAFFALRATFLLPWNAILVSASYIQRRVLGSPFERSFLSYISLVFLVCNLLAMLLANLTQAGSKPARRVVYSSAPIVILHLVLAFTTLPSYIAPTPFFLGLILPLCVLFPLASAFMQNATIALASWFGRSYMQSCLVGQAVVAVIVSVVQLAAALGSVTSGRKEETPASDGDGARIRKSALIFFLFSACFALVSMVIYAVLVRTSLFKKVISSRQASSADDASKAAAPKVNILHVMRKIRVLGLSVFWTFLVTLCVFPAITASILSVHNPQSSPTAPPNDGPPPLWSDPVIFSAIHFLVFNTGDWLGRLLPGIPWLLFEKDWQLAVMSALRTVCVPLFLMCNVVGGQQAGHVQSTPTFNSDIVYMLILLLFSTTNGYLGTLIMMAGVTHPSLEKHEVDTAATALSFLLLSGLVIGSLLSFGVRGLLCHCDPFVQ